MNQTDKVILKTWQLHAVKLLHSKSASSSELESCAIALKRDDTKLAQQCDEEAARRVAKWRVKKLPPLETTLDAPEPSKPDVAR